MKNNNDLCEDLTVQKLYATGKLSKMALLVCKFNGLTFLSEIVHSDIDLISIPKHWTKSQREFLYLQEEFKNLEFQYNPNLLQGDTDSEVDSLTFEQYELLESAVIKSIKSLTRRSFRALQISSGYNTHRLILFLLDRKSHFRYLENIGPKSELELDNLRSEVIRFVNKLHERE